MADRFVLEAELQFRLSTQELAQQYGVLEKSLKPINVPVKFDGGSQANKDVRDLALGLGQARTAANNFTSASTAMGSSLQATGRLTVDCSGFLQNLATQAGLAARRFLAFTVAAGAMTSLASAIKNNIAEGIGFERQLNRIAQVSGGTKSELAAIEREVTRLSTSLGASSRDLTEVSLVLKQAGLSLSDTRVALQAVAQASLAPNFGSQKEVVEGLIAAHRQYGVQARDFSSVLGSMNAVAAEFAVEGADLVTTLRKVGGAASQSGTSLNELLALFTSIRSTTRESAEEISTGLRTVLTRIQRPSTVAFLEDLGIHLRRTRAESQALAGDDSLTQHFVGGYEAVRRLSEALKDLPTSDPRYAAVVESLGGYRQVSRVIPLLSQFGEAQRALSSTLR